MTDAAALTAEPIREGIYRKAADAGSPVLLGSRCAETGLVFWPAERFNPVTGKAGTMEPCEIEGQGRLHSFTTIARGLPGFSSPYALASIELDAGPTLLAQLTDWQDVDLHAGMAVELEIGTVKTKKDGTRIEGPMFRPLSAEMSDA